jgi:hypothetical protein
MSIRSEVDAELRSRGIYGHSLTAGEELLYSWQIITFAVFALNITVWSPGMMLLFLWQRIFIDKGTLFAIIFAGSGMSVVNAFLAYMYAGNGWIKWDSFQHIFQPDALNWISGVQNWWYQNLYFSILLWSLVIVFALLQLIISHFAPNTKKYGYGLLNFPSLLLKINPSHYLTLLQDGALGAFVIHVMMQKQFDFVGKTSIFCFASIVMFWLMFSAFSVDISRWESYSRKNTEKLEREHEEKIAEYRRETAEYLKERAEKEKETARIMREIDGYIKDKKQNM